MHCIGIKGNIHVNLTDLPAHSLIVFSYNNNIYLYLHNVSYVLVLF